MVHLRRTHTVCVSLVYSTIFYPLSLCGVGGYNVEYAMETVICRQDYCLCLLGRWGLVFHIFVQQTECK